MERYRHSIDTVFAWLLFAVFAVSAVLLVLLGARIYAKAAADMNTVDTPVILSYLTEKLRGCAGSEAVLEAEDDRLVLKARDLEGEYATWIYVEDGCLKETLMPVGREPIAGAGSIIARVQEFSVEEDGRGMLLFQVTDDEGQQGSRYYRLPGSRS